MRKEVIYLINRIVHEIRTAMTQKLYLSALALALTLPDTCGKAEYPDESYTSKRYKQWCNRYVITDRCDSPYSCDMPYLNEDIIYSLRNSLLHQSTPSVDSSKIHEERCKIDDFNLVVGEDHSANGDSCMVSYGKGRQIVHRELSIYVSHLCYILCTAAESYYENNREKFDFIRYSIVDEREN